MAIFRVTYQHSGAADRFTADEVTLSPDLQWFHFVRNELVVVRVSASDVRVIENITADLAVGEG